MFSRSKRNVALLAGAAGFSLLLGVAVASGVVPHASHDSIPAGARPLVGVQAPTAAQPALGAVEAALPETPTETVPPTTAPPEAASTTAVPAPVAAEAAVEPEAESVDPPAPDAETAAPAPSAAVPRLSPTSFEVFQALQALAVRVPLFRPTEAQARQFGDAVCTAFDEGKSYAEVKSGVLSAVGQVPGVTVSPADADYAIRTAVGLFCPGHKSKLG